MAHTKQLTYITLGNPNNHPLIFLGGFPDDALSGWSDLFENLKDKYYIISLCIPQLETNAKCRKWGYSFDEIIGMTHTTIVSLTNQSPITLIVHDWGAYIGYRYENKYPNKVKQLIAVDIGMLDIADSQFKQLIIIPLYQLWFAFSYLISQIISFTMGNIIFKSFFLFTLCFPFLSPLCKGDKGKRSAKEINVNMCYLYFQFWKEILTGNKNKLEPKFPACSFLYMVRMYIILQYSAYIS